MSSADDSKADSSSEAARGPYRGSCLCGSVQFEVKAFDPTTAHCHCLMCRKFHGAGFATLAGAKRRDVQWLKGVSEMADFRADNGTIRQFCRNCGSSLTFATPKSPDVVEIALGVMDDPVPVQADAHIFRSSKANWLDLAADLPEFEAGRKG